MCLGISLTSELWYCNIKIINLNTIRERVEEIEMKKISVFLIITILLLSLTACHPEKDVEQLISTIGTVTLESEELIIQAQEAYDALRQEEKAKVSNADILENAQAELARQKDLIEYAKAAIEAIGLVTIDSAESVFFARECYDEAVQYDIEDTLKDAEEELIKAEKDLEEALACWAEIEGILIACDTKTDQGQYGEAADLLAEAIEKLPEGRLGVHEESVYVTLSEILVSANAKEAERLLKEQKYYDAMLRIGMCEPYMYACSDETLEKLAVVAVEFEAIITRNRPENGEVISRTYKPGRNTFEFTAGDADTCVKMELADDPTQYVTIFVRANESVTINLLNGVYKVKYTAGFYWFDENVMFGPDATYIEYPEQIVLTGYTDATTYTYYWHELTWAPSNGYGEEMGFQNMNPEDF